VFFSLAIIFGSQELTGTAMAGIVWNGV
jgi:hypothetical protein